MDKISIGKVGKVNWKKANNFLHFNNFLNTDWYLIWTVE